MSEENRPANAEYTLGFLDKAGGVDVLADPQARKEFILGLDYVGFKDWLIRLNGMARGLSVGERGIDGEDVEVMVMMPPEPEDKEPLLKATLKGAQEILAKEGDPAKGLEGASLIFGGAINYIHPFGDGNGRTSRVVGWLTKEGYDGSAEAQECLKGIMGDKGRVAYQNNPGLLTKYLNGRVLGEHRPVKAEKWPLRAGIDSMAGEAMGDEVVGHLSPSTKVKAEKIMRDHDFGNLAVTKIMLERGLLPEGVEFGDKSFAWVEPSEYFSKFTDGDIEAVAEESRSMRRERVQYFIDAIVEPSSFPIHLTAERDDIQFTDRDTNLRDYYIDLVREYSKLYTPRNPLQRIRDRQAGESAITASQAR